MKLSLLSLCLGLGFSVPQVYGLVKPSQFTAAARKFPRSLPIGWFLMLLGTAWFLYIVNYEPIADFSAYKSYMMTGFGAVGVAFCGEEAKSKGMPMMSAYSTLNSSWALRS